jgi:regulator of protease activity HflC (stomatin/prohibitin superfamily)
MTTLQSIPAEGTRIWIAQAINTGGSVLFAIIGAIAGSFFGVEGFFSGILCGLTAWAGLYVAAGWTEVPQQQAWVIERFGAYARTCFPGITILCFPRLVDNVAEGGKVSLKEASVALFKDPGKDKIDFACGTTAGVTAEVWRRVRPDAESVKKYVFAITNPDRWLEQQLDTIIRPILQSIRADDALKNATSIVRAYEQPGTGRTPTESFKEYAENAIGIEWSGIRFSDIDIPKEIVDARALDIIAQKTVNQRRQEVAGLAESARDLMEASRARDANGNPTGDPQITFEKAMLEAKYLLGLQTVQKAGANITFIGKGIKGVVGALDVDGER